MRISDASDVDKDEPPCCDKETCNILRNCISMLNWNNDDRVNAEINTTDVNFNVEMQLRNSLLALLSFIGSAMLLCVSCAPLLPALPYTQSASQDSGLFGPNPWKKYWKTLAHLSKYLSNIFVLGNPTLGENLVTWILVMRAGCTPLRARRASAQATSHGRILPGAFRVRSTNYYYYYH